MIPASFFFKSLTDIKQSIDEDLKSTYSDAKVSLVSLAKQSISFHIDVYSFNLFEPTGQQVLPTQPFQKQNFLNANWDIPMFGFWPLSLFMC